MSEQVINIRDRIEKMRTQMTGPNQAVARNKVVPEDKSNKKSENKQNNMSGKQTLSMKTIESTKIKDLPSAKEKIVNVEDIKIEKEFEKKVMNQEVLINLTSTQNKSQHRRIKLSRTITMTTFTMKIKNQ